MKLVETAISKDELKKMSESFSGGLVKAVIDIKKEIMVVDGSMHADLEKELLDTGSLQDDLWGINLYPDLFNDDFIEFYSMINVRPRIFKFSRGSLDENLQKKIILIVSRLVK